MKKILDWKSREVVNVFDEVNLWSAPFGRLLLENMPMKRGATIVDLGFGTGFPLIELSQRFGEESKIYGVDIWEEAIKRTKEKIDTLSITNIQLLEASATKIDIADNEIDLVTSNLGVNNFEEKEKVYSEIKRILKSGARLCITTNPVGTFEELFSIFDSIFKEMNLKEEQKKLADYIAHRKEETSIVEEFKACGLSFVKSKKEITNMRFVDGEAVLNHSLIRFGFRKYWENMIVEEKRSEFFERLIAKINKQIELKGEFKMTIPMLYLEFEK